MSESQIQVETNSKDTRKSVPQLKRETDEGRELVGKTFHHVKSMEEYKLLFYAFEEATNTKVAVYCYVAMPWLKFTRPYAEFIERFTQGPAPREDSNNG